MNFIRGEAIKVKDGTVSPDGQSFEGWQGRVFSVFPGGVVMELDCQTLENLSDQYLVESFKADVQTHFFNFPMHVLEKTQPRDAYEDVDEAQKLMYERMHELVNFEYDMFDYHSITDLWSRGFQRSKQFEMLNGVQRNASLFIIETFANTMLQYYDLLPVGWNGVALTECCLEDIPRKVSADQSVFEAYGVVLEQFFDYVGEKGWRDTADLKQAIAPIKQQIFENAADHQKWGTAKEYTMKAMEEGVNPHDLDEFAQFVEEENQKREERGEAAMSQKSEVIDVEQLITVRYEDGRVRKGVTFLEVLQDLNDGKCEIVLDDLYDDE